MIDGFRNMLFSVLGVLILSISTSCQDLTWTWLQGDKIANMLPTDTYPGGRSGAAVWTQRDLSTVWMFGGEVHKDGSQPVLKNDLWKYDMGGEWTLVNNGHGNYSDTVPEPRYLASGCGIQGAYFVISGGFKAGDVGLCDTWVYYIPENKWYSLTEVQHKFGASNETTMKYPSARGDAASWCLETELIVFGGADEQQSLLHDLWIFDMEQLLWMEAHSSARLPKDREFVSHLNYPTGRSGATTWLTRNNRLFMFGGNIDSKNVRSKHLLIGYTSDIWEYDFPADKWIYHWGGTQKCSSAGIYGTLGTYNQKSHAWPGCRRRAAAWSDRRNNLWMFGGDGIDDTQSSLSVFQPSKLLSDLWYFDVDKRYWIWKGGHSKGDQGGNYGDKGHADNSHLPGSRCETIDFQGWDKFYLYGGLGHDGSSRDGHLNDLWVLDVEFDTSVKRNAPYVGPVFGLILLMVGLVTVVSLLFMYSKGYFKKSSKSGDRVEYSRLMTENA